MKLENDYEEKIGDRTMTPRRPMAEAMDLKSIKCRVRISPRRLFLCVVISFLCGCSQAPSEHVDYNTTEIEGCEYLVVIGYGGLPSITHKGNCKNPIHNLGMSQEECAQSVLRRR